MKSIFHIIIAVLIITSAIFSQEANKNKKANTTKVKSTAKGIEAPQAVEGDVIFSDGTNNLLRITDEGTTGAIQFQDGVPSDTDFKLYRNGGTLYFNGVPVGSNLSLELDDLIDATLSAENSYYLGSNSGTPNSTGTWNTGLGYSAIGAISDGDRNTGMGARSLTLLSTGSKNTALGFGAGYHVAGDGNLFLGYEAGFNETRNNRLYIENTASATPLIYGNFEEDSLKVNGDLEVKTSTAIGENNTSTLNSLTVGKNNQAQGIESIAVGENNLTFGFQSAAFGKGLKTFHYLTTVVGRYNEGGNETSPNNADWNENDPLFEVGNGTDDANRSNALTVLKNGNVGIGINGLPTVSLHVDAVNGVVFDGATTGSIPVEGSGSRMMWYQGKSAFRAGNAGFNNAWDDVNIGNYSVALNYRTMAKGSYSFATGYETEAIGQRSTAMGSGTKASGDFSTALGRNVNSEHIGSFIIGDNTSTIFQTIADNSFMARFAGGYTLYSSSNTGFGVVLPAGGSSWSAVSDSTKKENFLQVDGEEILKNISNFNLRSWNYKGQDPTKFRHYGPMAQEFYAAFGNDGIGTVGNDTTIASADFDGINLIAIQALEKRTEDQKLRIAELETRIEKLENQNQNLVKLNSEYRKENSEFRREMLKIKQILSTIQVQQKDYKIAYANK